MNPTQTADMDSASLNRMLADALLENQQQLVRMERNNRLIMLMMLILTICLLAGGYSLLASQTAHAAGEGIVERAEQDIRSEFNRARQLDQREATKLKAFEQHSRAAFDSTLENVRADLGKAGNFEPLLAVAVILKDMKAMLEAVPRMADNMETMTTAMTEMNQKMSAMPNMAVDMHQMNYNMAVIAKDIDETMGRVGRMAPW